jgi:hypothetical protein
MVKKLQSGRVRTGEDARATNNQWFCWYIPLGMPFSQPIGEFHGRTEAFSGSVLAQPQAPNNTNANKTQSTKLEQRRLMTVTDKRG